ncbi:uncharacterized protein PADG_06154 [Paracoccidioides brasiliensis Pb18]|uniref:Uncharacterized protein n=1 Tax=Paracoccidioides brasiliensis (strain Pb18) TaxID=502780 RepID=C1GFW8_PARBD|nr:uncharacterized protein PADG_06154 [Paracoccidioides brasiliensis Pb18]EEH50075.1 hypothetical protein PADG_06154 [Paracoccidioides brasiliensis Pb18]
MNWTGGRLQRHSHKSHKFLKTIQKQYFAKARLKAQKRLSNGPSTPPAGSLLSRHLHGRVSPQQMRERFNRYKAHESRHLICKGKNVSSHHHHSNETIFSPSNPSLDQSHGSQTSRLQNSSLNAPAQYPQLNDPFSLQQHRKLQAETPEAQSFEDLRQKLLKRKDWVNLSIARPLRISRFLKSNRHVENLAKRRHRVQQEMDDHILNQDAESDADIEAGTMLDSPSNCLDCNGLDMDFSDRPNSNSDVIHANTHGIPTSTYNLGINGKNISQLKLGLEMEMLRAKGLDSQKLYPERSSPTNGVSYEPYRRGSVDVELPIMFETSRRHMFLDHQKHNPSSLRPPLPAGPSDCRRCSSAAVHCHTREDIFIGHLSNYGSVLKSDSHSQSQDPSESMLLDNEEIYISTPIETELRNNKQHRPQATSSNGDRGSTLHQGQYSSPPMSDIQSHSSTFNQLDVDQSSSSVGQLGSLNNTEAVDTRKHRSTRVRSPNAPKNPNPPRNQTAVPANHPRLPSPELQMQYCMHPERFPDDSLRYHVPNPYSSSNTSAVSDSDSFDDQSELRIRRDPSFVLNHSTREKSTPASLGSQDFLSSPNRREGTERGSSPKDKHGITGHYQCSSTPPTRLGSKNSAEPEAPAVKPQGNRDLNAARDTYADDYLWKRFIFGSVLGNSQQTSGYSKLPSPARVEASERAIADGPAYIRSLSEPNESCNETLSHIEATHSMFVLDSANSNDQGIESDSSGCEVSCQDVVVGITWNRFSHQSNCSEYGDIINGPLASQEVVDDNENLRI